MIEKVYLFRCTSMGGNYKVIPPDELDEFIKICNSCDEILETVKWAGAYIPTKAYWIDLGGWNDLEYAIPIHPDFVDA